MGTAVALVLVVVALAGTGVAVGTERWARTRGLARVRSRLAAELGTDDVTVAVTARPLVPALLRAAGTIAEVSARDVPVGVDGRLRHLEATVPDTRLDLRTRALTTGVGRFTAVVGEAELGRIVRLPGVVSRLELRDDGLRVWTVLALAFEADVVPVHDGLLVLPDPVQVDRLLARPGLAALRRTVSGAGLRLPLPRLPLDARIEELTFGPGELTVTGTVPAHVLPLAPPSARDDGGGAPAAREGGGGAPSTPRQRRR